MDKVLLLLLVTFLRTASSQEGPQYSYRLDLQFLNCEVQVSEPCATNTRIHFLLFTSAKAPPTTLNGSQFKLPKGYDRHRPLKVVIHGFSGGNSEPITEIISAYLEIGGYNVLYVDWYRLSNVPCYPSAALNTLQVGRCAAEMLARLSHIHPPHSIHLLGFSLGAHVAAFTSNNLELMTGFPVARITGLDPALPFFATINTFKLDKTDAIFVDVIHCNSGVNGKIEPSGHVDFYVNDGRLQPHCYNHSSPKLCSHLITNSYFAESISSVRGFWGSPCQNWFQYAFHLCPLIPHNSPLSFRRALMGEHVDHGVQGVYMVQTAANHPYALG